jgi:ADP-ribose pyrophosphatase YjhB (NUDIX family)
VVAFTANCEHVLLIKPRSHATSPTKNEPWSLPKGGAVAGETPEQNALRELSEETHCNPADVRFWPTSPIVVRTRRGPISFFGAWYDGIIDTEPHYLDDDDVEKSQWHDTNSLLVMTGIIVRGDNKQMIEELRQRHIQQLEGCDTRPPDTLAPPWQKVKEVKEQRILQPTSKAQPRRLPVQEPDHPPPGFEAENATQAGDVTSPYSPPSPECAEPEADNMARSSSEIERPSKRQRTWEQQGHVLGPQETWFDEDTLVAKLHEGRAVCKLWNRASRSCRPARNAVCKRLHCCNKIVAGMACGGAHPRFEH